VSHSDGTRNPSLDKEVEGTDQKEHKDRLTRVIEWVQIVLNQ
jgi:hypothetical protein